MRRLIIVSALGLTIASPAFAQPNVGQLLQGLGGPGQNPDEALHEAFERGYRAGRRDQARDDRPPPRGGDYRPDGRGYNRQD